MMENNKNDKLNEDKHLEKLLEVAIEEFEDKDQNTQLADKKDTYKKAVTIVMGIMVAFGVLLYVGSIGLRPQEFKDETNIPSWVKTQTEKEKFESENSEWKFEYPVKVPNWSKQPYKLGSVLNNQGQLYDELINFAEQFPDIKGYTAMMPSGIQGNWEGAPPIYTNNTYEETLEDGTPNPYYSYTLREDYLIAYSTYLQRLLNPTFGEWVFAQRYVPNKPMKNNQTFEILRDMFSENWWNNNIKKDTDYSALPVLADWEGNDFGGLEFAEREPGRYGTFFGVVNDSEGRLVVAESLGKDSRNAEILKINTPVKYVAFGANKDLIEIPGNLIMTLASNNKASEHNRVVIIDVVLIFK